MYNYGYNTVFWGETMNKTKSEILKAAVILFSKNGYERTAMDEIASSAGIAKGTLYYHFNSKEDILNFAISRGITLMEERACEINDLNINPLDKLRKILKVQLTVLYENRELVKVILSQMWGQEQRQQELRERIKKYISIIETIIVDAMESNLIKKGDSFLVAHLFFGSLVSAAMYELIYSDDINVETMISTLMEYSFKGML